MLELSQPETLWQHANLDANILALNIVVNVHAVHTFLGQLGRKDPRRVKTTRGRLKTSLQFT
jgi:hypothetical protein